MVPSFTPTHSPVLDSEDHFDSFKTSSSNIGYEHQKRISAANNTISASNTSSMKSSKSASDFFAKRATPGNVNFLLNANSASIGEISEEVIDISDDTVNS